MKHIHTNTVDKLSVDGRSFWKQVDSTDNVQKLLSLKSEIENYFLDARDKQILKSKIESKIKGPNLDVSKGKPFPKRKFSKRRDRTQSF